MNVVHYEDASAFCDAVLPHLLTREAEHNLMISIALRLANGTGKWGEDPPRLFAIEEQGAVVAVALQTPPYPMQLTRMDEGAMTLLVDRLRFSGLALCGVMGPVETADAFAKYWTVGTSLQAHRDKGLGVYQLDEVIPPDAPSGYTEEATPADEALLVEWIRAFQTSVGEHHQDAQRLVANSLKGKRFWLWNDPDPVSLAGFECSMPSGARIGSVYTPPEHRGKGYASANVAALSQRLLDGDRKFCCLFTDLANPTSNGIYQKIGYRHICDFVSIGFE